MKISQNFDIREFIPKLIWDKWGTNSTWFVNPKIVSIAEFYKSFFTTYFKNKYGNEKVVTVLIVINNWHTGGVKQWSGLRLPQSPDYREQSQHSFINAFDCELFIVFSDGKKVEANYKEVHEIMSMTRIYSVTPALIRRRRRRLILRGYSDKEADKIILQQVKGE